MTSGVTQLLPVPDFYHSPHAAEWGYQADVQALLAAAMPWRQDHRVKPAGSDRVKIHLLLIDVQKDFCFPGGTLYVGGRDGRGAVDDNDRLATFIYRNLPWITEMTCTMDTHFPYQIFFPAFWLDGNDQAPPPHTEVTADHIWSGQLRPNPSVAGWLCNGNYTWLQRQAAFYCDALEKAGKYTLYLWPPHCLLGSDGHALAGVIQEARLFHAFVRGSKANMEIKGGNALTENYSVLAPEVLMRHDGRPLAQRNTQFVKTLLDADAVIIAGQAASHCVKSSIEDLLGEIVAQDAHLARKVYILRDCMSAVAVPDAAHPGQFAADFTPQAEAALARFADAGMHVVSSTEPIADWPDLHV
ncbi:nicotinamidase [Candidatus Entotheonella palauensis]|uniref:nicotinamidase n=1 Tax=Candidatus Entotheonella palauensis TaxID=93172 RepID=UPI000B7DC5BA|nr:nicotinamidase [Candidatus Entotheonella palauensis]